MRMYDGVDNPADRLARAVWAAKYRQPGEQSLDDSRRRVARALATVESKAEAWALRFEELLTSGQFLPGGRILAGAGTERHVTLFNCFVMGLIEDSMDGIFEALREGALTMQQGGGVGYDFSTLRPAGTHTRSATGVATGPVSFMRVWDAMCGTVLSQGARRGAMMACLRCDHPDIEAFIEAKRRPGALSCFNLSVLVSDAFLEAVDRDEDWPLLFPADALQDVEGGLIERAWSGDMKPRPCRILKRVKARELWDRIMRTAYESAEPGVLFIDRINRLDNLGWREQISATNPCGEVPLPPYGACDLGSFDLTRFVRHPFTPQAEIDRVALAEAVPTAVRLLDNVIDASRYPLPAQQVEAHRSRRVGLGITGLGSALVMLGLRYDSEAGRELASQVMHTLRDAAYRASVALAAEKGPFPVFDAERLLERPFIQRLPRDIREGIRESGLRNSHLLAIAPAGTISLLAGNVSSGLEPVFAARVDRRVRLSPDHAETFTVEDAAVHLWHSLGHEGLPPAFVTASEIAPRHHLQMQAVLQHHVDQSISKTINAAPDTPFQAFASLYREADQLKLKGCTVYRPNRLRGQVIKPHSDEDDLPQHCEVCQS